MAPETLSNSGSGVKILSQFSFVRQSENVNASKTRRAVRSHAMKAVRRQQRQERTKTFRLKWPEEQSPAQGIQLTWPEEQSPGPGEQEKRPRLERRVQQETQMRNVSSNTPLLELFFGPARNVDDYDPSRKDSQPGQKASSIADLSERGGSLRPVWTHTTSRYFTEEADENTILAGTNAKSLLGAGRVNPFQTFPVRADRGMAQLADHYVTIMPAAFYGTRCRKPIHIDMYRVAICHQVSIHAMTAYASKSLDFLRCSEPSQLTLSHTMRAVRGVNEGLLATRQGPDDGDDGVILSIALLAFGELRFGRKDLARQHWIGLREVVRFRGGFDVLRCDHSLKAILAWNSTVWSASRYSTVLGSPNLPSLVAPETPKELFLACQDFIQFFHYLNDNAYSHSVHSDPNDTSHTAHPYRHSPNTHKQSLFAPGTPLYRLLRPSSDNAMGVSNQRASDACQTPCLLYINAVMLEYADEPYLIDDFFANLINTVHEDNLDTDFSPEHLFIRLLQGIDGTRAGRDERLYRVTRLAYIAKRLGRDSIERVRSTLLENLVLSDGPCRNERLFTWDPAELEDEIMSD